MSLHGPRPLPLHAHWPSPLKVSPLAAEAQDDVLPTPAHPGCWLFCIIPLSKGPYIPLYSHSI